MLIAVAVVMTMATSCTKETLSTVNSEPTIEPAIEPKITSVAFYRVQAGSNISVGFTVNLMADSTIISKVALMRVGSTQIRWEVKKPITGRYIMYDHLGDYPTYSEHAMYFFSFIKKDGKTIDTTPFQVY